MDLLSAPTACSFGWIGWGLLLGGAADNTLDRILHGYVTDMLQFQGDPFVFNLADQAIRYGGMLLFIHFLLDAAVELLRLRRQKV